MTANIRSYGRRAQRWKLAIIFGGARIWALAVLAVADAVLTGRSKKALDDGASAKVMRFNNLDNYRYCEVFLIGGRL